MGVAPSNLVFTVTDPYGGLLTWQNNDEYQYIEIWERKNTISFNSGSVSPQVDEILTGATSGATAKVIEVFVTSGTWGGGDAQGTIALTNCSGTLFQNSEDVNGSVGGNNMLTVTEPNTSYGASPKLTIGGDNKDREIGGLAPSSNYCYHVIGGWYEPPGTTDESNEDCETTYSLLQDPTDIVTTVFSDFIEITWKDNSSAEDVFCIYRQVDGGGWPAQGSPTATVAANMEYWRDTAITPGENYEYRVCARENPSNYSGYVTGTQVTAYVAPNVPTSPTLSDVTDETMRFSWTAPAAGDPVTGYKVQISDTGVFGGEETEYIVASDVLDFLFKELTPSDQYWARVCTYNGVGNSAFTSSVNDTTDAQYEKSDFEVFIRDPNIEPVYIAKVDLKMDLSGFTLTGGQTYTYEVTIDERGLEINAVWEDGDALTEKTSIAEVEATASTWWWDTATRKLYVHSNDGTDPDNFFMEGGFIHLIPNRDFDYADTLCTLPPWLSAGSIPGVTQEIKSYYEGNFRLSTGSISFMNSLSDGEYYFDKRFEKFTWIGAKLAIYCGKETFNSLSKFRKMFSAYISEKSINDRKITFSLGDIRAGLDRTLILNKYWKTNYPGLDDEFDGREIFKGWGYVEGIVPAMIIAYHDAENRSAKFNYHDGRSKNVGKVTVNDIEKTKGSDYYVDLQRSVIIFDKSLSVGEDDIIRVSFTGEVNSADEPIENGAEVFKHIMNNEAGINTTELNTDWIYETKYANTKSLSVPLYKDTNFNDIIKTIEHSTEAFITQDGEGKIGLRKLQTIVSSAAKYIWDFQSKGHEHTKNRGSIFWKVKVYYNENVQTQEWEVEEATDDDIKHKFPKLSKVLPVYVYYQSSSNAQDLANNILSLLNKAYIEDELPMILFDVFPGDLVPFSRNRFFDSSGTASEVTLRILRIEKNPQTGKTLVKMEKV